jgi:hypothetical protein
VDVQVTNGLFTSAPEERIRTTDSPKPLDDPILDLRSIIELQEQPVSLHPSSDHDWQCRQGPDPLTDETMGKCTAAMQHEHVKTRDRIDDKAPARSNRHRITHLSSHEEGDLFP